MSATYPEYIHTNYPDSIDHWEDMIDVNLTLKPLVDQYYNLYNAGDFTGIDTLLSNNPELKRAFWNAEKYNVLKDTVEAQGKFFKDNIYDYILQKQQEFQAEIDKFTLKGEYNPNITYYKNNWVIFNDGTGLQAFICIDDNNKLGIKGIEPTNTTYWYKITIKGEKGETGIGIGLTFRGEYNPTTVYAKDNGVQYGGMMFASKVDNNVGNTPDLSKETDYWVKALDIAVVYRPFQGIRNIVSQTSNVNFMTGEIIAFNPDTDTLDVYLNSTYLTKGLDYSINANNQSIDNLKGTWNGSVETPCLFTFIIKRFMINNLIFSDGQSISDGTITKNKFSQDVQDDLDKIDVIEQQLPNLQPKTDNTLNTTSKTVVGAINENAEQLTNLSKQKLLKTLNGVKATNPYIVPGWSISKLVQSGGGIVGDIKYFPIYIAEDTTFDSIAISVVSAVAGGTIEARLYDADGDLLPNNQIIDFGVFDVSTTGIKEIVSKFTLQSGYYFIATRINTGNPQVLGTTDTLSSPLTTRIDLTGKNGYNVYSVTGVMSNPAIAPTNFTSTGGVLVLFKIAQI